MFVTENMQVTWPDGSVPRSLIWGALHHRTLEGFPKGSLKSSIGDGWGFRIYEVLSSIKKPLHHKP